mgnify:CR=1 FL=1
MRYIKKIRSILNIIYQKIKLLALNILNMEDQEKNALDRILEGHDLSASVLEGGKKRRKAKSSTKGKKGKKQRGGAESQEGGKRRKSKSSTKGKKGKKQRGGAETQEGGKKRRKSKSSTKGKKGKKH